MIDHFSGIVPNERWKNDVLSELRQIRELLEGNAQTIKQEPAQRKEPQQPQKTEVRKYTRRGAK